MNKKLRKKQSGFTLIELSIVLIIIGLIVSGILVGQDLIDNARVGATITQIQRYEAAANVFHDKYRSIPGDLNKATTYINASLVNGNGDRRIVGGATNATLGNANGEPTEFWMHLSASRLIAGSFTHLPTATSTKVATVGTHFPETKLLTGGIAIASGGAKNVWYVGTVDHSVADITTTNGMTASSAFAIDSKLDDGLPGTGAVFYTILQENNKYVDAASYDPPPAQGTEICIDDADSSGFADPTEDYNIALNSNTCAISILAAF